MNRFGFDNAFGRVPATMNQSMLAGRGNGYVVNVLPKTDYLFDGRVNTSQLVPFATGIDASSWVSGLLVVRVHARGGTWGASATLRIYVQNIMLTPEDPDVIFAPTPVAPAVIGATLASVTVDTNTVAGALLTAPLTNMGPMLRVIGEWAQGGTASTQATASLGIDVVGRPA
jgi:hypothetical protein